MDPAAPPDSRPPPTLNPACRPGGGFELSLRSPPGGVGRAVHLVRGTPVQFAAIIPGDGVVEVVLTSGLNSFL